MTKPKHPGRTAAQRKALDLIGCGEPCPPMSPKTRDALLAAGLIHEAGYKTLGKDRFGEIKVALYEMPIPVHMQWCEAVAAEEEEEA